MIEIAETQRTFDPRTVRPEDVHSVEECVLLMGVLDKMKCELKADIRRAEEKRVAMRKKPPYGWISRTYNQLDAINSAWMQLQQRRGELKRLRSIIAVQAVDARSERRFIEAAKRLLAREQYLAIWAEANSTGGNSEAA